MRCAPSSPDTACNYTSTCVEAKSCKVQHGGDTCGPSGTDSCCKSLSNVGAGGNAATIDTYNITAGRMRAFVEDTDGNLRKWITDHTPAWWNASWTAFLPTMKDSGGTNPDFVGVYQELGPYVHGKAEGANEGCYVNGTGARTYRIPDAVNAAMGDQQFYPQDMLDERSRGTMGRFRRTRRST